MNKKKLFIILCLIFLGVLLFILRAEEDAWLCQNNQWVKHGNPSASMPIDGCGSKNTETQMANPASVYCSEQGGKSETRTEKDGSQTGWCVFPDYQCDEWEFFRTQKCTQN